MLVVYLVLSLFAVGLTVVFLSRVAPMVVAAAVGVFLWTFLMWWFGDEIEVGPFTHYPWWLVMLSFIVMVAVIVIVGFGLYGIATTVLSVFVILTLVGAIVQADKGEGDRDRDVAVKKEKPTTTTTGATTTTTTPQSCPGGHTVKLDPNREDKFISGGVKAVQSEDMRVEVRKWVAKDPKGLYAYYKESPAQRVKPINSVDELVVSGQVINGNCYSAVGIAAYKAWVPLWNVAQIEQRDAMPPGWANSGVSNGQPYSGAPPTGNTEGWMVTYVDASGKPIGQVGVMKRCANLVTPKPAFPPKQPPATPPPSQPKPPPTTPPSRPPKCGGDDPSTDADGVCSTVPYNQRPAVYFPPRRGNTPGVKDGQATETRRKQAPSSTPNPQTGSRLPPEIAPGVTNPPTQEPNPGQVAGPQDPCGGDPNACG